MEDESLDVTGDFIGAVGVFLTILRGYLSFKKHRQNFEESDRQLRSFNRPSRYCMSGLEAPIFVAVMEGNETVVNKHLRVSLNSLRDLIEYSKGFLSLSRGWREHYFVTVCLYWLACGASYRVTGAPFNISRYTVRDIVHKCLNGFVKLLPSVIKYPTEVKFEEIGAKFNRRAGTNIFAFALGAIDGTHVKVKVPSRMRDQYINRKLSTTIHVQAVCTSSGEFSSICVGYPGSVHDERVLQNSKLFKEHRFPPDGYYLLGDSGYKCRVRPISIGTPFKRVRELTPREERFNKLHSKARTIIESSFGIMKNRWQAIFDKILQLNLANCIKTITVACIMHNICLKDRIEDAMENIEEVADDDDDDDGIIHRDDDDNYATEFRRTLAEAINL